MLANAHLTTSNVWTCTGILAILDIFLLVLARRVITREHFRRMRWWLVASGSVFFLLVWLTVLTWAWEWFYAYIFPGWSRFLLPPAFALLYGLAAFTMVWLSLKLPLHPAVTWCLLGGVEGLVSHVYAIYFLGAASKPPIMQGSDPFSVLIFAVFEKTFYWSLVLLACGLVWRRLQPKSARNNLQFTRPRDT